MATVEGLESLIRKCVDDVVELEVKDLSDGCGDKFFVLCVSDSFEGKSLIERHRQGTL